MRLRTTQGDLEIIPRDKETARFSILAYNPVLVKFENGVLYQMVKLIRIPWISFRSDL